MTGKAPVRKLRLAPSLGYPTYDAPVFKESVGTVDPVDHIRFLHDHGFPGVEDTFMKRRPPQDQARIGEALARLGMGIGGILNNTESTRLPLLGSTDPDARTQLHKELVTSVETAKRCGAKLLLTVSGRDMQVPLAFQFAAAVENLRYLAEIAEKHSVVIGLEPTNEARISGMLMHRVGHAYLLVKAVNSPAVKIIADVMHFYMAEPSITATFDRCWDEIATIQVCDCPNRTEPGTGEVNFPALFGYLRQKGYDGLVGFEHNLAEPGLASEKAFLAYLESLNNDI